MRLRATYSLRSNRRRSAVRIRVEREVPAAADEQVLEHWLRRDRPRAEQASRRSAPRATRAALNPLLRESSR